MWPGSRAWHVSLDWRSVVTSERNGLEKRVTDLAVGVVGMKGALEAVARGLQTDVEELKQQNVRVRRLSKYNRRTHFMVLTWLIVGGLLASDLGRRYCGADGEQMGGAVGATCNVVFWTTEHGGGPGWRGLGFLLQVTLLVVFWARSQVPADLYGEVAVAQVKRERDEQKGRVVS